MKKKIIDGINKISGRYSSHQVFSDWVMCLALSISNACDINHNEVWEQREQLYIKTMQQYSYEERMEFLKLSEYLTDALEIEMGDVLGEVYMEGNMGNDRTGQFFTPFHVSELVSNISIDSLEDDGIITLNEPSCGGGGMIIATAKSLKEKGINYQRKMRVVAQDLDWRSVYMCYCQLSLLGINATVVQGDTLREPFITKDTPRIRILYTPMRKGALL